MDSLVETNVSDEHTVFILSAKMAPPYFYPKRWYLFVSLKGSTTQKKNIVIFTVLRTSNRTNLCSFMCLCAARWSSLEGTPGQTFADQELLLIFT
jgi:hypothetical protein